MEFFKISLVVHWLGLGAFTALGPGSIPGRGTRILQASQCGQKKKSKNEIFQREIYSMVIQITQAVSQCSAIL